MLSACAAQPPANPRSATDELEQLSRNGERRKAVSGMVRLTSDQEGSSLTVPGVILVEWPDKVRLEVQDPLGGMVALLVLNGDQFWLYEQRRPELLTGPVRKLPFGLIPVLSSNDLVRLFLARPDFDRLRQGSVSGRRSSFTQKGLKEEVVWSEGAPEPTEWTRRAAGGAVASARYEEYEFKDGLHYPTKIYLSGPGPGGEQRRILVAWKEWEPSVPKRKKLFQIPQEESFGRKIKALP